MQPTPRKIVWAKDESVKDLRPYVQRVLDAIAQDQPHAAGAFVTDKSSVGDFYLVDMEEHTSASITKEQYTLQLALLSNRLGTEVAGSDLIVDVAFRIREGERT